MKRWKEEIDTLLVYVSNVALLTQQYIGWLMSWLGRSLLSNPDGVQCGILPIPPTISSLSYPRLIATDISPARQLHLQSSLPQLHATTVHGCVGCPCTGTRSVDRRSEYLLVFESYMQSRIRFSWYPCQTVGTRVSNRGFWNLHAFRASSAIPTQQLTQVACR